MPRVNMPSPDKKFKQIEKLASEINLKCIMLLIDVLYVRTLKTSLKIVKIKITILYMLKLLNITNCMNNMALCILSLKKKK